MIFNKTYLGHLLIPNNNILYSWIDCICENCKSYICFDMTNGNYVCNIEKTEFFDNLELTCDEIIIKKLLE